MNENAYHNKAEYDGLRKIWNQHHVTLDGYREIDQMLRDNVHRETDSALVLIERDARRLSKALSQYLSVYGSAWHRQEVLDAATIASCRDRMHPRTQDNLVTAVYDSMMKAARATLALLTNKEDQ